MTSTFSNFKGASIGLPLLPPMAAAVSATIDYAWPKRWSCFRRLVRAHNESSRRWWRLRVPHEYSKFPINDIELDVFFSAKSRSCSSSRRQAATGRRRTRGSSTRLLARCQRTSRCWSSGWRASVCSTRPTCSPSVKRKHRKRDPEREWGCCDMWHTDCCVVYTNCQVLPRGACLHKVSGDASSMRARAFQLLWYMTCNTILCRPIMTSCMYMSQTNTLSYMH